MGLTSAPLRPRTVPGVLRKRTGADLMVALFGAASVTLVGFGGSEVLFGPGAESIGIEATLLPSIAAGVGAFFYLLVDLLVGDGLDHVEPRGAAGRQDRGDQAEHQPGDPDPHHRRHRGPIDHSGHARREALQEGRP